ncbi:septation protein A [Alginatibacterium sediminis]|uniref:Inner membrane-spanning protein YciB n=1 Tax=Alginatibacterium sediminis TaxID=2164068 RepID=A0A420EIL1_9ALTE|nr:septation protein A [Alginatibacterium sediminis]RKF20494.1 septation protein A [Alginatibacterium sediminis]
MKQFFEFIPLIVFFAVYKMQDIYLATGSLIITTGLLLAYNWFKHKKVEKMHLVSFVMVLVFGTLTMIFRDDAFIKWKVTVVYAIFAVALFISQYVYKTPLLQKMLGKEIEVPAAIWAQVNLAWTAFFAILAGLNIYIAYNFSLEFWVNFKVFWLFGFTIVFTVLTVVYLFKHMPKDKQETIVSAKNEQNKD